MNNCYKCLHCKQKTSLGENLDLKQLLERTEPIALCDMGFLFVFSSESLKQLVY